MKPTVRSTLRRYGPGGTTQRPPTPRCRRGRAVVRCRTGLVGGWRDGCSPGCLASARLSAAGVSVNAGAANSLLTRRLVTWTGGTATVDPGTRATHHRHDQMRTPWRSIVAAPVAQAGHVAADAARQAGQGRRVARRGCGGPAVGYDRANKRTRKRIESVVEAVVFGVLALSAGKLAAGGAGSSGQTQETFTARVLAFPLGNGVIRTSVRRRPSGRAAGSRPPGWGQPWMGVRIPTAQARSSGR